MSGRDGKERYRETRELVRIALNDGMTQAEIARLCRTQQSQVSMWANGPRKARTHQLEPLIERYGDRVRQGSQRSYLTGFEQPVPWEESEILAAIKSLTEAVQRAAARDTDTDKTKDPYFNPAWQRIPESVSAEKQKVEALLGVSLDEVSPSQLDDIAQQAQQSIVQRGVPQIEIVTGPLVFRHLFRRLAPRQAGRDVATGWQGEARWLVHQLVHESFVLIRQQRRRLVGIEEQWWQSIRENAGDGHFENVPWNVSRRGGARNRDDKIRIPPDPTPWVECSDDSARWISEIEGPYTLAELLDRADVLCNEPAVGPHDRATVPFLIRKALADRGLPVPGVSRFGASG
jgi:hypothetical protein